MRIFVTGATGFIGGHVATKLRARGDEVVALVRSPEKAARVRELGCELVQGDLTDEGAISRGLAGADAAIHAAAIYKVGVPKGERESLWESNVRGTERVLDAAAGAGVGRVVYVSTVNVFGNTRGKVVEEGYERNGDGFLSVYDETKYRSHQIARERIEKGAPIVIVQPGAVYGPGDHSEVGNMIDQTRTGKLKMLMFPSLGLNLVHVEDVADGILLALDKGEIGASYVLGGQIGTMGDVVAKTAQIEGRKAPKREMPAALIKAAIPIGPVVGKLMGFPPNLGEMVRVSDGVTYWASHDKAKRELGYSPRDLDTGLRETLAAG